MENRKIRKFCAFIITNGRPEKVLTYNTLKKEGYTGDIILVVDDLDKTKDEYIKNFGDAVYIFDKRKIAARTEEASIEREKLNAIIYGRNVCFDIAKEKGYTHFLELDDDYTYFAWRRETEKGLHAFFADNLDKVFNCFCDFLDNTNTTSICFAQGGDFIGGKENKSRECGLKRKAMNSFFCRTDRYFQFVGKINEDVNTYVLEGSRGKLFFTYMDFMLNQLQTQSNKGGMTDIYLDMGTYVKSFYSVMFCPSSVSIKVMGAKHKRVHHKVNWENAVPKILNEKYRKV